MLVDDAGEKLVLTIGKPGILWKLDRETGKYIDHKETMLQNVFDVVRSRDRASRSTAQDIVDQRVGEWIADLPQHRRAATTGRR